MPSEGNELFHCYNRGCGQKFDPNENREGAPFFHDAYKGWSCCKKKCTDFTEFLNIKGCTKSFHNSEKPPEAERPPVSKSKSDEVIEYKAPQAPVFESLERPPFESPMVELQVEVSPALVQQVKSLTRPESRNPVGSKAVEIAVGTSCKNGGCKQTYDGPEHVETPCTHHPGYPVFHEGLKFWSCCQRRTTDFNSFLEQEGCVVGKHVWIKEKGADQQASCRYDWHQTSSDVVVSVFAKKYDPDSSSVQLNPIRLKVHLFFPEEQSVFNLDLELCGVVDVTRSVASMLPTKLEVKLRKGEPGSWPKLDIPRQGEVVQGSQPPSATAMEQLIPEVDAVDLSDL
ncbi:Cysteine and histidine-rich domain-containing protein [Cryptotermes secundus]|uniref:Cysteine and histidine-rich domain-containing protein n=1 Tax=Cryptotermes secundus TaxID=105785 RepID=A0A2J7QJ59_9NEOP|nr:cysteine and histidine-rich domain-containing protein isoform X2 [Cryptotermes secundus]PNF28624.1 Cysteine and histidine-rich domain-containing protein [Cryptotermes secundus]